MPWSRVVPWRIIISASHLASRGSSSRLGHVFSLRKLGVVYGHLLVFSGFSILATIILLPTFGRDFPSGVDTPTFLHLAWVTEQAVSGALDNPFIDPYWYGGFPYLVAYPPLGYGLTGLISAIPGASLIVIYQIALVTAVGGIGACTFWLGRELGIRWWMAALAGVLTAISYPVLSSVFLWGWFTSVLALPFSLMAIMLLERAARIGQWRGAALGGMFLAVSTLVHHMTGATMALALMIWFLFHLASGIHNRRQLTILFGIFGVVTALVVLPWGIPFLMHASEVGFRREIAGNWLPAVSTYQNNILNSDLIGEFVYPSYLGSQVLILGIGGAVFSIIYFLTERYRTAGITVMLLTITWFSMGAKANPLIYYYPFSGIDVGRYHLYMSPFLALLAVWLVDIGVSAFQRSGLSLTPRVGYVGVALLLAGIMVMPTWDLVKTWDAMEEKSPYKVDSGMETALEWLAQLPSDIKDPAGTSVYCVGCWNWDAFLIPYLAGVALVDGWADEGAPNVDLVRPWRRLVWDFPPYVGEDVIGSDVHRILVDLGTNYVLLAPFYPLEDTAGFQEEFMAHPELYAPVEGEDGWGEVQVYEVLQSPQEMRP